MATPPKRIHEIDGIRGWASLCVLVFHLTYEIFGVIHPGLRQPVLKALFDGPLAVYVFFLLSGDVLSQHFTRTGAADFPHKMVLKRYFRLAGPTFFSCLCVFLLMKLGLALNHQAAPLVQRPDWLGSFLPFGPSFMNMLRYGLIQVFTTNSSFDISYNPFLWTMQMEMTGSLIVFLAGPLFGRLRRPLFSVTLAALFLALLGNPLSLFLAGIILGRLRAIGWFQQLQEKVVKLPWQSTFLFLLFILDAYLPPSLNDRMPVRFAMAFFIVATLYASRPMIAFMGNRLSTSLGRLSFPLYYMQFPVIISWTSWATIKAFETPLPGKAFIAIILSSFLLVFGIAIITAWLEEKYLHRVDHFVTKALSRQNG